VLPPLPAKTVVARLWTFATWTEEIVGRAADMRRSIVVVSMMVTSGPSGLVGAAAGGTDAEGEGCGIGGGDGLDDAGGGLDKAGGFEDEDVDTTEDEDVDATEEDVSLDESCLVEMSKAVAFARGGG
jgi:hypothetical protein